MKLLSRKALISVATATAIAAGSLSTPAFAEDNNNGEGTAVVKETGSSSSDIKAKDVKDWIGVVSAIIGIITTILTFAGRLDKFFK
ncbi:hypothetical protein AY498_01050 [Corynebacterium ulcerans]|uniref:hypothetical protein n=1 Tax=Corynebacterium ulcerans TaxID=65058 RepID=UPI000C8074CD|nr:hypothetical protein [Corynebacterium ulcerans]PME08466.1 hypothetical protein AY498_01050 [Corynebacterium ulcerans]